MTRILKQDSNGKVVSMTPEELLKLNEWYVISPDTLRDAVDYICEANPALCKRIFDLNH